MSAEKITPEQPILAVFTGTPGVGKSEVIQYVADRMCCETLYKDAIADPITLSRGNDYKTLVREVVYQHMYRQARQILHQRKSVLLEATNRTTIQELHWEDPYRKIAKETNSVLRIVRLVVTSEDTVRERLAIRNHPRDTNKLTPEGWIIFMREEPIEIDTLPTDCGLRIPNDGPLHIAGDRALAFLLR